MKTLTILSQLDKIAAADLRTALKDKYSVIGNTKRGTLTLSYSEGTYTLSTFGHNPVRIAQGTPAVVRPILASLYACAR
jgi:hypothetical protein